MTRMILNIMLLTILIGIVSFLSWILFINRGDDKFIEVFLQIILVVVAGVIILLFKLFSPIENLNEKVHVLLLRDQYLTYTREFSRRLLMDDIKNNGYEIIMRVEAFSFDNIKKTEENGGSIGMDVMEYAFFVWLGESYLLHWDNERIYFDGISGGGGQIFAKKDADKKVSTLKYEQLREKLTSNQIMPLKNGLFSNISYPKETDFVVLRHDKIAREYSFKNSYINFKISIRKASQGILSSTKLAESILKTLPSENKWQTEEFVISFECTYSKLRRGNPSLIKQKKWVEEIVNGVKKDFDWGNVKEDIIKVYK